MYTFPQAKEKSFKVKGKRKSSTCCTRQTHIVQMKPLGGEQCRVFVRVRPNNIKDNGP